MPSIPEQIGPYIVRRQIGRGGMGVVYLARDPRLARDVAIKALNPEMAQDEDRLARLRREARIIAQLNHPHIVQIFQLLEHRGRLYLVLEYVPGWSLADMIEQSGPIETEAALAICGQVARAMEAAHGRGVIHRDLKPSNVRITGDGAAKVLDFGIAHTAPAPRAPGADEAPPGTEPDADHAGLREGTPGYMAPEQARGEPADARADIFSFGCVLYECLAGAAAFDTPTASLPPVAAAGPDWSKLPPALAAPVRELLRACLAAGPDDRPQTMADVRRALDAALGRRATSPAEAASIDEAPNNLPLPATAFVGREDALRELADLVTRARLITLAGTGGCGKTRLALELARRLLRRFPDGVYLAELAATTRGDFVPGAVAAALGVRDRPNRTTVDVLCEHLADRTLLLVLDNCEHVIDAARALVEALLRSAPALRIVATSRETLRLEGEHLWPVPGLALPQNEKPAQVAGAEAVALFVDRARALRPAFALSAENAGVVARICRRLDGIPLAIELAAARVQMLTPEDIDRRLDDRFRLLAGDARGRPERHRTLRAAVDWSYRMLSESEKKMLRSLSVFAGGWTLEGAVAVCGPGGRVEDGTDLDELAVLDLLTHLADRSLVIVGEAEGESRYRLLETVRAFAAGLLEEEGEEPAARDRHLDFHLALAEETAPQFAGVGQAAWLARLERHHDDLLAALDGCAAAEDGPVKALRLCAALMRFWQVHGHFQTGLDACTTALDRPGAREHTVVRAGALRAAGVMAQALGDYGRAVAFASEALAIGREIGDRHGVALALNSLGNAAYYRGDVPDAKRLHEESLAINRELGLAAGIATSLNNLGNVAHDLRRFAEAERLYAEALEINRQSGNPAWQAINLNNLALVAQRRGDRPEAIRLHGESLAIRRQLGDPHGIAESLGHLAGTARADGDADRARRRLEESLTLRRDLGDRLGVIEAMDQAAMLASSVDQHERAARIVGVIDRLRAGIGSPRPDPEQEEFDGCLAVSRAALGEAAFDAAVAAGRSRRLDEAVAEAMAWLTGDGSDATAPTRALDTQSGARPTGRGISSST